MTQQSSLRAITHNLLSSVRNQPRISEVINPGFLTGVQHDGIIVGPGDQEVGPTTRVFLQVTAQPVVDDRVTEIVLRKPSRLQNGDGQTATKFLFLYSGSLTTRARQDLDGSNVIARSLRSLEDLSSQFWATLLPSYKQPDLTDRAQVLLKALDEVPPGSDYWSVYEGVCEPIFEFVFSPDLGTPKPQSVTLNRSQRRDFIMKNEAEDGFWAKVRERYSSDYLVVEVKNSKGAVNNSSIWQLAAYLKGKGTGFFGMLVSPSGVTRGVANPAIIDQWVHASKMIVPISNADLRTMVEMRDSGGDPTELVDDRVDRIRCSV